MLIAGAAVFAGCYQISSETVTQKDGIGPIELTTNVCETFPTGVFSSSCPSNSGFGGSPTNILVAYRVPDGVMTPDTFTGTTDVNTTVTFTKDQTYTDALTGNANSAPPSGEHWVGYRGDSQGAGSSGSATVDFTLPTSTNGVPFKGPLKYRTVVGWIQNSQPAGPTPDPVQCAADPTQTNTYGTTSAICIDSPDAATYPTDNQVPTRDLAIAAGGDESTKQNSSATLAYTANFAGNTAQSAFDVSVSTDAPSSVKLTPSVDSFTPGTDSSTPITVRADVAPTTPTGTYSVTLIARNSAGQARQATEKLVVTQGAPVNLTLPFVGGTDAVGKTVTCDNGSWSSSPTSYAYQWTRSGNDIAGATSPSYVPTQEDGAMLVSCRVTATNPVGKSSATAGAVRIAQEGGADVDLTGPVSVKKDGDGTYTIDPGITVSCPPRLTVNCGGGKHVTANAALSKARTSATTLVGHGGFAAKSGTKHAVRLHLTRRGSKLLRVKKKLTLVATVVTRNHQLQRVSSQKRLTVRVPRSR